MEVVNPRAALLSNFEVLSLLRELENDQLAETRAALAVKKERTENGQLNLSKLPHQPPVPDVCENLRTVEFEAISYLSAPYQPVIRQTAHGIQKLTKGLAPFGLTKSEKLQIVNLAPTEPVELYVIVEELEDRLSEKMDEILALVRDSLAQAVPEPTNPMLVEGTKEEIKGEDIGDEIVVSLEDSNPGVVHEDWDDNGMMEFVDTEGAFEGDLDVEDMDD